MRENRDDLLDVPGAELLRDLPRVGQLAERRVGKAEQQAADEQDEGIAVREE